jgi:hypothetical protein
MKATPTSRARPPRKGAGRRTHADSKRTSHYFHTVILPAYVLAIVWTTLGHAAEFRVPGGPVPAHVALLPARLMIAPHGRLAVRAYVQSAAKDAGVDPRVADWIVTHESQHHPEATGDGGESRGLWQINKAWHPEVSDSCAYDVTCSTRWSLERIRDGYVDEWSTWKYCKEWFEDCPF